MVQSNNGTLEVMLLEVGGSLSAPGDLALNETRQFEAIS